MATWTTSVTDAYLMLGQCNREMGRGDAAVEALRKGLKAWPASPLLERALGEMLFRTQYDSTEAGKLLEHAARLLPRDPEARHYYARWAYLNARHRICATQEKEAVGLPGLSDLAFLQMYTLLGMCEGGIENAEAARAAFKRAGAVNSKQSSCDPIAATQYVQFLTRYNDDTRAAKIVDEVLERVSGFGPAHLQKAKYLDRAGQSAAATTEARLALASAGNDLNSERACHTLLARCFAAIGRSVEAAREQQWIADHPNPEAPR
ncbi:MAG: hypothetical protein JWN34_1907 [Bryobacterales bacterium]|nr:hypothetical protein [Bryobacterales bacterium]